MGEATNQQAKSIESGRVRPLIYIVEDDQNIRDLTCYALEQSNYEAMGFESAQGFLEQCDKRRPAVILLDIMLPGVNGINLLKELRSKNTTQNIPIMMITAKGTELDVVAGLEAGADDYLKKPFSMMELISRISALLRMALRGALQSTSDTLKVGSITISIKQHLVLVNNKEARLTAKEFSLLLLFVENPEIVFTRGQLLRSSWGFDYVENSRTVDVHIQTLRQKLGEAGKQIETIRGVGYRMRSKNE